MPLFLKPQPESIPAVVQPAYVSDAWPGSGQQALQLLAFYLSWLRACWSQINSSPGSEAAALKAAGNAAFKARDWATAIRLYSTALDVPVPSQAC
ncbi:hypothetical protein OEZ85_005446 [Tetradesmus obliquus]|uniref:Uncharacterized protein n=1 Tax=Tetradesmus obliquus TaxID=3088 RepID=A0ABY8UIL7_TETOB|nr:hypothetical protein OEZ85_005446 [Tetradesmus obliquus]